MFHLLAYYHDMRKMENFFFYWNWAIKHVFKTNLRGLRMSVLTIIESVGLSVDGFI
jgi:hypothetical protein